MTRPTPSFPNRLRTGALTAFLLAGFGFPAGAGAQVDLDVTWLFPAEAVFISDFDPLGSGRQPELFQIRVMNGAADAQDIVLRVTARMERPDQAFIFEGETHPFTLEDQVLRLTNRDLASRGRDHSLEELVIGDTEELQDRLLRTGRFPSGEYAFEFEVLTPQGVVLAEREVRHQVTNPSRVELVGPGGPFGDPPPTVSSPSPRFLWSTDAGLAGSSGDYRIRVVRVEDAASGDEAIEQFPVWEGESTGASAVYPGSVEAIQLVPGATYAWQVVREIRTSGGLEVLESPIYWFRMASGVDGGGPAGGTGTEEPFERQLRQVLQVLGLGPEVDRFEPQGSVMIDGRAVPQEAVTELLRGITAGDVEVPSATVR